MNFKKIIKKIAERWVSPKEFELKKLEEKTHLRWNLEEEGRWNGIMRSKEWIHWDKKNKKHGFILRDVIKGVERLLVETVLKEQSEVEGDQKWSIQVRGSESGILIEVLNYEGIELGEEYKQQRDSMIKILNEHPVEFRGLSQEVMKRTTMTWKFQKSQEEDLKAVEFDLETPEYWPKEESNEWQNMTRNVVRIPKEGVSQLNELKETWVKSKEGVKKWIEAVDEVERFIKELSQEMGVNLNCEWTPKGWNWGSEGSLILKIKNPSGRDVILSSKELGLSKVEEKIENLVGWAEHYREEVDEGWTPKKMKWSVEDGKLRVKVSMVCENNDVQEDGIEWYKIKEDCNEKGVSQYKGVLEFDEWIRGSWRNSLQWEAAKKRMDQRAENWNIQERLREQEIKAFKDKVKHTFKKLKMNRLIIKQK